MALIVCSECGKEFSERAAACPHCGCPNDSQKAEVPVVHDKNDGVSGCMNGCVTIIGVFIALAIGSVAIDGINNGLKGLQPPWEKRELPKRNLP